ncbi:MAG: MBL fold metallo-hydrolase [Pseudomonadota bacterium]
MPERSRSRRVMLCLLSACASLLGFSVTTPAFAVSGSKCIAMAQAPSTKEAQAPSTKEAQAPSTNQAQAPSTNQAQAPSIRSAGASPFRAPSLIHQIAHQPATLVPTALNVGEVRITYVTHASFRIETQGGIAMVTDYSGIAGEGRPPDVVTMNHAHETHWTDTPDPRISHVLRGWNPNGGPANHELNIGDVFIRNVPTDIRNWGGGSEPDGNSIFIFEVAGLCIGHLGHLHHELAPADLGVIGQLDIVMAPVDGSYTLDHDSMVNVLKLLKARLVIPMHAFGQITLERFLGRMASDFEIIRSGTSTMIVSANQLPDTPTIQVMPESLSWSFE